MEAQQRLTRGYDVSSVASVVAKADATKEHGQPGLFHGKLKNYQLKGMNWLLNLYDQVRIRCSAARGRCYDFKNTSSKNLPFFDQNTAVFW
jgi:SNF2 family DNA or RNA helicase